LFAGIIAAVMNLHSVAAWAAAFFLASSVFSHTVALRLMLLIAGTLCALGAVVRDRSLSALPPLWLPFVLWAAWSALSLAWSLDLQMSEKELRNEVLYTGAALWLCYVGAQAQAVQRCAAAVLAGAGALAGAISLYYFLFSPNTDSWHGGPGAHSSAVLALMPCVLGGAWYAQRKGLGAGWQAGALLVAAFLLLGAYSTLNRTVWIGLLLELLLIGWLVVRRSRQAITAKEKAAAIALAATMIAGSFAITLHVQAQRELAGASSSLANDPRLNLWHEVLQHVRERPFTGYGFGRGVLRQGLKKETGEVNLWHAHNIFLDVLLQTGIPGLALFLLLLGATLREGWRLARDPDDARAACGIVLIALLAGVMVRNLTDVLLVRQSALLFWGEVGALLGIAASRAAPRAA
jgi:O-antigen ligase